MNQIISQIAIQSTLTLILTNAHCKYSRKFNDRRILHLHTPHNRDLPQQDDKLETNKRIGTDSSHSGNERETQQKGDLLFVCENGKATHNGREVYSLTEGRMNTSSLARSISLAYSMSTHPTPASPRMVVMILLTASLDCAWNNAVSACSRDTKQSLESTQSEEETAMNPPSLPS